MKVDRRPDIGYGTEVRIDGNGPPVVLVHGTPLDLRAWDGLVELLSADLSLVRYDLRGHGAARSTPLPASYDLLADDLQRLLDACRIDRPHLVGHSFGGQIVAHFARHHPDRLASLTTVCSRMTPYPSFAQAADRIESGDYDAVVSTMMGHWFPPAATTGVKPAIDYSTEAFQRAVPASLATALRLIAGFDGGRELAQVPSPIRFVAAEEDQVVTPPDLRAAAARLPTGSFSLLRGCNHMVPLEHPERVVELLRSTLPV